MSASFTPHFQRNYQKLPKEIQAAFDKQLVLLLKNLRHPSLRAKKYDEGRNVWQARESRAVIVAILKYETISTHFMKYEFTMINTTPTSSTNKELIFNYSYTSIFP